jgi:hypothetical protein
LLPKQSHFAEVPQVFNAVTGAIDLSWMK